MKKIIIICIITSILAVVNLGESVSSHEENNEGYKSEATIEGTILKIDITPMYVDGPALLRIRISKTEVMDLFINTCEGRCSKKANELLSHLKIGDRILGKGEINKKNKAIYIYDDEKHFLRIISDKE